MGRSVGDKEEGRTDMVIIAQVFKWTHIIILNEYLIVNICLRDDQEKQ